MVEQTYAEFFLNSRSDVVEFELLELSHPAFMQTHRVVRNSREGVTVTLDGTQQTFQYYPVRIDEQTTRDNLDFSLKLSFGDLGEVLPAEMDAVEEADGYATKPTIRYIIYRSDDLTAPIFGPLILEAKAFTFNRDGATFDAKAPDLNVLKTGELYRFNRFPMLKGFL